MPAERRLMMEDTGLTRHLALLTEYDGSGFFGWQIQKGQRTVQQVLRDALTRLTGEENVVLTGCSRTDAGVHARGHVSDFRTGSRIPTEKFHLALNSVLPKDVSVLAACDVPGEFNARFAARGKIYTYRIWNTASRPALERKRACHIPGPLDLEAMAQAIPLLIGHHDFCAFRDSGSSNKTTIRTLNSIGLSVQEPLITLTFEGDGFLYHMVRILTGTLVAVAQGKLQPGRMTDLLSNGNRKLAGMTMPPEGLCLEQVHYASILFENPKTYYVDLSQQLWDIKDQLLHENKQLI